MSFKINFYISICKNIWKPFLVFIKIVSYMPSKKNNTDIEKYIGQLNPNEKKAYEIAKDHLGTSFNIEKSNGFLKWKSQKN